MILNVSGRTDIVAFYTKWFMNRYHEGFVDVRNPFYQKQVSRIYFKDVDLIVFCTKNPKPIIKYLKEIDKTIIFHITLTPYKKDLEPNIIDKKEIIESIKEISKIIDKDNIYLRYDPIILNDKYNINYHIKAFTRICELLDGYINHIIVSFVDNYKNVQKNYEYLKYHDPTNEELKLIGTNFSMIAGKHHMSVQTCSEYNNLTEYGFIKSDCISKELAKKLTGKTYKRWLSRNNRYCNCVEMADIGAYNSCNHLCKYCYANYDENKIHDNICNHDDTSTMLIGKLSSDDIIKERRQ